MPLPSPLPLATFEQAIQADPEALGVFYFGSLGRGAATRHSDLDIFVLVPDSIAEPYQQKLVPLLQLFGEIHWLSVPSGCGFVGPNWNQVDIEFARRSELEPSHRYAGARVIKDTEGVLVAYAASCAPEEFVETPASAGAIMHDVIGDLLYQARNNARGALWDSLPDTFHPGEFLVFEQEDGEGDGNRHSLVEEMLQQAEPELKQAQVAALSAMDDRYPSFGMGERTQIDHPEIGQTGSDHQAE